MPTSRPNTTAYKAQAGDKEYHVRHILVGTEAEAKAVIAKLKGGAKFEELAKTIERHRHRRQRRRPRLGYPDRRSRKCSATPSSACKKARSPTPRCRPRTASTSSSSTTPAPTKLPALEEVKGQIEEALQQKKLQAYQEAMVNKAKVQ